MTEHITISRELLRQALGALEQQNVIGFSGTITALHNALEQPAVEPSAVFYRCNHCWHGYEDQPPSSCDCSTGYGFERVEYFTAPQAQQPAPQECKHCTKFFSQYRCNASQGECDCPKCQGFCTCSQQPHKAVKLTDEELRRIRKAKQGHDEFARAIEQAVWEKLGVTE